LQFLNSGFSQNCFSLINAKIIYGEEVFMAGCTPISYCFDLYVDEGTTVENLELSITSPPGSTPNIQFLGMRNK